MINVCIVGYGAIGPIHARALSALSDVRVAAVCDIDKSRLDKAKKDTGARLYTDFDEVINDSSIDSVHICTPHYLHFPMIVRALEAGKQVVCEKPLVYKKEELEALCAMDTSRLYCIFQNRTNRAIVTLRHLLESDPTLGSLKGARAFLTWHRDAAYYQSGRWRGKKITEGGGVLINQAIHTLDLLCYLTGGVSSVRALAANHSLSGVIDTEDTMEALLSLRAGASALFYASNACSYDASPFLELTFENASFRYGDDRLYKNGAVLEENAGVLPGKACWGSGHEEEFRNIYSGQRCLRLKDVENTLRTVFALYESAACGGKEILL